MVQPLPRNQGSARFFLTVALKPAVLQIPNLPVQDILNTRLTSLPSLEDW